MLVSAALASWAPAGCSSDRESDDVPRALVVRRSSVRSVARFVGRCQHFYERRQRRLSNGWFEDGWMPDIEERAHEASGRSACLPERPYHCRAGWSRERGNGLEAR